MIAQAPVRVIIRVKGHQHRVVSRWLWPGNKTFLEVAIMVVTWWIVAFLPSDNYSMCGVCAVGNYTNTACTHQCIKTVPPPGPPLVLCTTIPVSQHLMFAVLFTSKCLCGGFLPIKKPWSCLQLGLLEMLHRMWWPRYYQVMFGATCHTVK